MMPVLFSGASTGPATAQLGRSILGAGLTIFDKLNEAEAVSQFQTGQQALSKRMNQFDQLLARDPDIDTWRDKTSEEMDKAWNDAQGLVKNPLAANMLDEWWTGQKISKGAQVNDKIIYAKTNQLHGQFLANIGAELDSDNPSEVKKANIAILGEGATSTMVVDKAAWETKKEEIFNQLDESDLLNGGVEAMTQSGKEQGILWMNQNFPGIPQAKKEILISTAERSYDRLVTIADTKATAANSKLRDAYLTTIYSDPDALAKINPAEIVTNKGWTSSVNVDAAEQKRYVLDLYNKLLDETKIAKTKPKDDTLVQFYDEWDASGQTEADRTRIKKEFQNVIGRSSAQVSQLDNYMNVSKKNIDSVLVPFYEEWDTSKQTEADRNRIKAEFRAIDGRTAAQVVQLDTYLDVATGAKKRAMTDDEEDELMREELRKYAQKDGVEQTDQQKFEYEKLAYKRGLSVGGIFRFMGRLDTARNLTDDQKAQLKVLTVLQADISGTVTQDQKDAASRAYSTVIEAMHGKPSWLDTPGGIQKYAAEQYKVEIAGYIKGQLSFTKPKFNEKWTQFWTGKATAERIEAGNLVQAGRVEDAAKKVSVTAAEFSKNYFDEVKAEWSGKHPKLAEPINLDTQANPIQKRTSGKYAGLRPMSEFYSPGDKKVYQVWMDEKGKFSYYSMPEAQYDANALNGDKWRQE